MVVGCVRRVLGESLVHSFVVVQSDRKSFAPVLGLIGCYVLVKWHFELIAIIHDRLPQLGMVDTGL